MKSINNKLINITLLSALILALITSSIYVSRNNKKYENLKLEYDQIKEEVISLKDRNKELEEELNVSLKNQPPKIKEIKFSDIDDRDIKDGWITVPDDGRVKIKFKVDGNCTSIDMYIVPTGTQTYLLQKIIDSILVSPNQTEVEYVWEVPYGTMGHFYILAYNGAVARISDITNIYYGPDYNN